MRILLCFILILAFSGSAFAQLEINEVCSKNNSVATDGGGFTPDFIELINVSSGTIELEDFYLSDRADDVFRWELPEIELAAGEIVLIWCESDFESDFHTNFNLDSSGETLYLTSDEGILIDQVSTPALRSDHSYGRAIETGSWGYYDQPTPAQPNSSTQYEGYTAQPEFSVDQGFYDDPLSLVLSGPQDELKFTIGGESPLLAGIPVAGPIQIDSTQVVRAVALSEGFLPSNVVTQTYFIDEDKYLPVVSLTTEPEDLWGQDSGIYVMGLDADTAWPYFGANWWDGRQIPVHVELYEDEELIINQGADMRIHGGKAARNKEQKPLRIIGRKEYGDKYFHHQLIDQKPLHQYKKFVLRNSGGDFNEVHFRDCWIHRMTIDAGLDVDVNGCEPAVVYLNGEYWGIQNIREKVDKYYCRFNGGYDEDVTYTILEEDTIILEGNRDEFNEMLEFFQVTDLSDPSNFDFAAAMLDAESMTDYIIVETFWNNTDWPANNQKYWKPNIPGGQWRFVLFDLDVSLNAVGFVSEETDNLGRIIEDFQHIELVSLWWNMMENDEYWRYFINRYADLLNTCYEPELLETELLDFLYEMEPEMEHHRPRWGSSVGWWWYWHINPRALVFVQERTPFARDQVMEAFELDGIYDLSLSTWPAGAGDIDLNTITIEKPSWEGKYYVDVAIDLKALPKDGFKFQYWRLGTGEKIEGEELQMAFYGNTSITAVYESDREDDLQINPNPNQGSFAFEFLNDSFAQTALHLVDNLGRVVFSEEMGVLSPGVHRGNLDLQLAAGSYNAVLVRGQKRDNLKFVVY